MKKKKKVKSNRKIKGGKSINRSRRKTNRKTNRKKGGMFKKKSAPSAESAESADSADTIVETIMRVERAQNPNIPENVFTCMATQVHTYDPRYPLSNGEVHEKWSFNKFMETTIVLGNDKLHLVRPAEISQRQGRERVNTIPHKKIESTALHRDGTARIHLNDPDRVVRVSDTNYNAFIAVKGIKTKDRISMTPDDFQTLVGDWIKATAHKINPDASNEARTTLEAEILELKKLIVAQKDAKEEKSRLLRTAQQELILVQQEFTQKQKEVDKLKADEDVILKHINESEHKLADFGTDLAHYEADLPDIGREVDARERTQAATAAVEAMREAGMVDGGATDEGSLMDRAEAKMPPTGQDVSELDAPLLGTYHDDV
jgi:hydrogenase maturation factor